MKVLCLLATLCLPSLILCGFKEMIIHCTTQNEAEICKHTNSCEWNISLAMCPTLQVQCLERTGKKGQKKICSSTEECGLTKVPNFIDRLLGNISCKSTDGVVKCNLTVACNHTIYLCEKAECELDHLLSGSKNKRFCRFHHNITQCIQKKGKHQGPINCNSTFGIHKTAACKDHLGSNTKRHIGNTTDPPHNSCNTETIILRFSVGVLALVLLVLLVLAAALGVRKLYKDKLRALAPQHHGALAPQHQGALAPQHQGALAPQHQGALDPQHQGALDPQHQGALDPQHQGALAPQHQGALDPQHQGALAPQHQGALDPQHQGALAPQHQGAALSPHQPSAAESIELKTLKNPQPKGLQDGAPGDIPEGNSNYQPGTDVSDNVNEDGIQLKGKWPNYSQVKTEPH